MKKEIQQFFGPANPAPLSFAPKLPQAIINGILTLRIFTTTLSLLVMLMASKTSLYFPRPSFRTSW